MGIVGVLSTPLLCASHDTLLRLRLHPGGAGVKHVVVRRRSLGTPGREWKIHSISWSALAGSGFNSGSGTTSRRSGTTCLGFGLCPVCGDGATLLPDWLFPHRGYSWQRIVSQTFLHSQGVFGVPLRVMFTYVFLFVLFGALLEKTGAIGFILGFARQWLGKSAGGPAKVAVVGSGLMGSLSGSAVANTATTGTFTIPLMRAVGFRREIAAGVEAAASSGGALVPPIMGAGAYMMLETGRPTCYLPSNRASRIPARRAVLPVVTACGSPASPASGVRG